ncbi:hypothetical protein HELRODRAFT_182037 [Helobdella robusta]|uniref:Uncharacterized protein n=1 Tax=Helobdella robusta TaxID=6412 RepID=T1FHM6_HELRO|nr:hypothetical protein HELRODRAFT_182037 [Helobdella robusta]ESN91860.1 hypothetical protein HELRODRAFT_182037 [Helobdella robusta]
MSRNLNVTACQKIVCTPTGNFTVVSFLATLPHDKDIIAQNSFKTAYDDCIFFIQPGFFYLICEAVGKMFPDDQKIIKGSATVSGDENSTCIEREKKGLWIWTYTHVCKHYTDYKSNTAFEPGLPSMRLLTITLSCAVFVTFMCGLLICINRQRRKKRVQFSTHVEEFSIGSE